MLKACEARGGEGSPFKKTQPLSSTPPPPELVAGPGFFITGSREGFVCIKNQGSLINYIDICNWLLSGAPNCVTLIKYIDICIWLWGEGGTFQLFYINIKKESFAGGGGEVSIYIIYILKYLTVFNIYIIYWKPLPPEGPHPRINYICLCNCCGVRVKKTIRTPHIVNINIYDESIDKYIYLTAERERGLEKWKGRSSKGEVFNI